MPVRTMVEEPTYVEFFIFHQADYVEVAELPEGGKIYAAPLSAILRHHIREEPERIV